MGFITGIEDDNNRMQLDDNVASGGRAYILYRLCRVMRKLR